MDNDNGNNDVKEGSFLENVLLCDNDNGGRQENVYDMTW